MQEFKCTGIYIFHVYIQVHKTHKNVSKVDN